MARSKTRITVSVDNAAVRRELQGPDGLAPRYLQRKARQLTFLARAEAPVGRTGKLGRSIRSTTIRRGPVRSSIRVGAFALSNQGRDYAVFVSKGTLGANIVPKRGKYMKFERAGGRVGNTSRPDRFGLQRTRGGTGQFVFAKRVAGQAPNNFLLRALEELAAADPNLRIIRSR